MEILSPAGSFECLRAAVKGGADAVYAGGKAFSARKSAANFDNDELIRAVDFCHLFGVKIYVAINILIKESEISDALSFLKFVREIGADGVIIQDLGLLSAASKSFPDLKINASTQMTVHSSSGVKILEKLGAKRVVLSREVSFDEIKKIKEKTNAELEVFCHGALCMSYSGQCLFSSIIGSRSGNRGACAQPCRLSYSLSDGKKDITKALPLLSPKDLCLIKRLTELDAAGVASLKIEGRMKSPEYVGLVTRVYSDALKYGYNEEETEKMLAAFSRGGSSEGFFSGRTFKSMMDYRSGAKIDKAALSEYKTTEGAERKIPLFMEFSAAPDEKISLKISALGETVNLSGALAEKAEKVALLDDRAEAQLKKLGETCFFAEKIVLNIAQSTAVSIKAINELRRNAVCALEEKICKKFRREPEKAEFIKNEYRNWDESISLTADCLTEQQAFAAKKMGIERIYVPVSLKEKLKNSDDFIYTLPAVIKDGENIDLSGINKICAQNIGQLDIKDKEIYANHRLNLFNGGAARVVEDMDVKSAVLSPELNLGELKKLSGFFKNRPEVIAYGRLPLMTCENCIIKSATGSCKRDKNIYLKDRMGEIFPIVCESCRNVILNSKVIFMADRADELRKIGADLRLMFTTENEEETEKIISLYKSALSGEKSEKPAGGFTRGHFKRGVF